MNERAASDASCSSSLNSSFRETEDDQTIASIMAKEEGSNAALNGNGRLAKRLSHLDSIPHTPRVVGEIPDPSEASLDHERLSERLATNHLEELQIEGDGNCQFRAVADQLFHNSDHHKSVRKEVIKQLKHHKKLYEGYVPMKYSDYLKKMKKSGEWGDHVTLQAAADRMMVRRLLQPGFYIFLSEHGKLSIILRPLGSKFVWSPHLEVPALLKSLQMVALLSKICGSASGAKYITIRCMIEEMFLLKSLERSIGYSNDMNF